MYFEGQWGRWHRNLVSALFSLKHVSSCQGKESHFPHEVKFLVLHSLSLTPLCKFLWRLHFLRVSWLISESKGRFHLFLLPWTSFLILLQKKFWKNDHLSWDVLFSLTSHLLPFTPSISVPWMENFLHVYIIPSSIFSYSVPAPHSR